MTYITSPPTVELFLIIPVPIEGGWAWAEHPRFPDVLAEEYAYSAREATALVRSYGRVMSRMISPQEADRFAVFARGRITGMVLARDEWRWDHGAYEPDGEPWCTWRPAARRYFEITGRLIERQCFRSRIE